MLILLFMAYLVWRGNQIAAEIAATATLEDPVMVNARGQPIIDGATNMARRRPHDDKIAAITKAHENAKMARTALKSLLAMALVWSVIFASYRASVSEIDASTATLADCAKRLAESPLQACLAPLHASYIGAEGDAAGLEVMTWAILIL